MELSYLAFYCSISADRNRKEAVKGLSIERDQSKNANKYWDPVVMVTDNFRDFSHPLWGKEYFMLIFEP